MTFSTSQARNSFDKAVSCSDNDNWVSPLQEELKAVQDNVVCDLIDFPNNQANWLQGIQDQKRFER